ncbi:F-box protein SKIP17 [Raphanus sativus]|uniref:F-box protein SKIP17-like isoform X2 n=1 Tax=Raphanus sativus TaxID=3726 RepID=A0A6J0MLB3_RAPSA|nr:F-box protein SKIP17-like isoform X2 [Raphanus sativus]KAJ4905626.1 F-box protein SKIP17 [Raphanus sativus]
MDSPSNPAQNPSSFHANSIISSLLSFPNSSPNSISSSFDRELEKALASASHDASVQENLVDRTLQLASLLLESTKRSSRKRAPAHNSSSWFLPSELTVKVFSMLDTRSLMQAATCCIMFNKCAMDRFSYVHVDLTTCTSHVDRKVVCTMLDRAGKELRSLKLGSLARPRRSDSIPYWVNGRFLSTHSYKYKFIWSRLKSLWLYNIRWENLTPLFSVLSVCSNLTDLRIVGLKESSFMYLFVPLTANCRLIKHLCIETYKLLDTVDNVHGSGLIEFVTNSPNLTSLRLIGFRLTDEVACTLAQSSRTLKYLNLSRSHTIKGRFLRDLGNSCKENPLRTLIMRNCLQLQEKEVVELCNSLLKGKLKSIRHIDVSNERGLASSDGVRSYNLKFPLEKLKEKRSDVTFVADFPLSKRSGMHYPVCHEEDGEEQREIEMLEAGWSSDSSSSDYSSEDDLG